MAQNDLILNILANPHMSIGDFQKVGFSAKNTSLEDERVYTNSSTITENPLFQNNSGEFDKQKFHDFYIKAAQGMQQINLEPEDYEATYSKYNIFAPVNQRNMSPQFELTEMSNPDRLTKSMLSVGMNGPREFTPSEIAQSQKVWNSETKQWMESPEDMFSFKNLFTNFTGFVNDNFGNTKVLAQYDEDVDINGKKRGEVGFDENNIEHQKGEYMVNDNGTYYYRTLKDGENIYGKQVLHYSDILTREGSALNAVDFLDSDDIEKSPLGSFVKNASLIGAMFLPYVGTTIAGATIFQQAMGLGATLGKIALGSDNPTMNWLEGLAESTNPIETRSEYSQGKTWTIENLLGMVGDVVGQLRQQRLLFQWSPSIFKGKWGANVKNQEALESKFYNELNEASKINTLSQFDKGSAAYTKALTDLTATNKFKAAQMVEDYMKDYYKVGEELSKAYMTLLTVNDIYGEAKEAGATDFDSAVITAAYAAMEYALLSSDIGKWILPELRANRLENKAMLNALTKDVRESFGKLAKDATTSEEAKRTYLQRLVDFGKSVAKGEFAVGLGKKSSIENGKGLLKAGMGSVFAGASAEAIEETSEELLADFSKVLYNGLQSLKGSESRMTPFENFFDRYGMSFLGGFLGGGISSAAFDFKDARRNLNMDQKQATQKLIYKARNNELGEIYDLLDRETVGNKNLSASKFDKDSEGNVIWKSADGNDNQDFQIKQSVRRFLNMLENTLDSHGGNLSDQSLLDRQTLRDLRFRALHDTTTAGLYIQKYNELITDLVDTTLKLKELDTPKTKSENGETDTTPESPETKQKRTNLEKKLKELDKEIENYTSGKLAPLFMASALLETTPYILKPLMAGSFKDYVEQQYHKSFDKVPEEQLKEAQIKYQNYLKTSKKDDIDLATRSYLNLQSLIRQNFEEAVQILSSQDEELTQLATDYSSKLMNLNFGNLDNDTWMEQLSKIAEETQIGGNLITTQAQLLKNTYKELKDKNEKDIEEFTVAANKEYNNIVNQNKEAFEKGIIDEETLNNSNSVAFSEMSKKIQDFTKSVEEGTKKAFEKKRQEILIDGQLKQAKTLASKLIESGYINGSIKDRVLSYFTNILNALEKYNDSIKPSGVDLENIEQRNILGDDPDGELIISSDRVSEIEYSQSILTPEIENLKQQIEQVKKLKYTPILQNLDTFALSVNGGNISQLLTTLGTIFNSNASNLNSFNMTNDVLRQLNEAERIIDLYIASLEGARVDDIDPFRVDITRGFKVQDKSKLWGINKVLNEVHAKAPKIEQDTWQDLPEIDGNIANMMIADAQSILELLETYKKLYTLNQGQKLNVQTRVATRTTFLLYTKVKQVVERLLANVDIEDRDKLQPILSLTKLKELTEKDPKEWNLELSNEDLKEIERERIQMEDTLYDFFNASDILYNEEKLKLIFNPKNFALNDISVNQLSEGTLELEDSSFIGYLASVAAIKSTNFYGKFKDSLNGEIAPLMNQELAIRLNIANGANGTVVTNIIKAYRNSLTEYFQGLSFDERKKYLKNYSDISASVWATDAMSSLFINHDLVPQYDNITFIDGIPGSGKSAGVGVLTMNLLKDIYPDSVKNAWIIHGGDSETSTEESEKLKNNLKLKEGKTFNRFQLLKKLSPDYVKPTLQNGIYKYEDSAYSISEDGRIIPNWKLDNNDDKPSIIVIDEAQQFTQLELLLIDKYAKANGIAVIMMGDLAQSQTAAEFKLPELLVKKVNKELKEKELGELPENFTMQISLARNQVLHTFKLGSSMRTANNQKNQNMIATQVAYSNGKGDLNLHYYEDDSKLAGDVVISADINNNVKNYLDKLISLGVRKVNFATYNKTKSTLYNSLMKEKKYADILDVKEGVALGQEGDYWIVELDPSKNGYDSYMQDLYTGQTRGKIFSMIISNNEIKTPVGKITLNNIKDQETHEESYSPSAIKKYTDRRIKMLNELVKDSENILSTPRELVEEEKIVKTPKTPEEKKKEKEKTEKTLAEEVSLITSSSEDMEKAKDFVENHLQGCPKECLVPQPEENVTLFDYYNRKMVLVDINGIKIPFYCSTGSGGKENVKPGKWYPVFGIEPTQEWINKGTEKQINDYYGSAALKAISEYLDQKYGDIRDNSDIPHVPVDDTKQQIFYDFINQSLSPVKNHQEDTIDKFNQMLSVIIPNIERAFNNIVPDNVESVDEGFEPEESAEDSIAKSVEELDSEEELHEVLEVAAVEDNEEPEYTPSGRASLENFTYFLFSNATFETGVTLNDDGTFEYAYFDERIDSLNGFRELQECSKSAKIKSIATSRNYKEGMNVLGTLRRILLTTENKADIERFVATYLGLSNVYVRFAIKTSELQDGGLYEWADYGKLEKEETEELPYAKAQVSEDSESNSVNKRNLVAIIGTESNGDIIEIPILELNNPITMLKIKEGDSYVYDELFRAYKLGYNSEPSASLAKKQVNGLLEVLNVTKSKPKEYSGFTALIQNYLLTHRHINFINDRSWTPQRNLDSYGPALNIGRGLTNMENADYLQTKEWESLDSLKSQPDLVISQVMRYDRADGCIQNINGQNVKIVSHPKHPFILYTDQYMTHDNKIITPDNILQEYIWQIQNGKDGIKLVYVLPPKFTLQQYLDSLINFTVNKTGKPLGNQRTAYKILMGLYRADRDAFKNMFISAFGETTGNDVYNKVIQTLYKISTQPDVNGEINELTKKSEAWNLGKIGIPKNIPIYRQLQNILKQLVYPTAVQIVTTPEGDIYMNQNPKGQPHAQNLHTINEIWNKAKIDLYYQSIGDKSKAKGNFVPIKVDRFGHIYDEAIGGSVDFTIVGGLAPSTFEVNEEFNKLIDDFSVHKGIGREDVDTWNYIHGYSGYKTFVHTNAVEPSIDQSILNQLAYYRLSTNVKPTQANDKSLQLVINIANEINSQNSEFKAFVLPDGKLKIGKSLEFKDKTVNMPVQLPKDSFESGQYYQFNISIDGEEYNAVFNPADGKLTLRSIKTNTQINTYDFSSYYEDLSSDTDFSKLALLAEKVIETGNYEYSDILREAIDNNDLGSLIEEFNSLEMKDLITNPDYQNDFDLQNFVDILKFKPIEDNVQESCVTITIKFT